MAVGEDMIIWERGKVNCEYKTQINLCFKENCTGITKNSARIARNNRPVRLNYVKMRENNRHILLPELWPFSIH